MHVLFLYPQDYKTGFGGVFGVQTDRVDASAAGWDHLEKVPKHSSQKGRIFTCEGGGEHFLQGPATYQHL